MDAMRTKILLVVASLTVGVVSGALWQRQQSDDMGARLRRECVSLVDEVMKQERTVNTRALMAALASRGIVVPHPSDGDEAVPGWGEKDWLAPDVRKTFHAEREALRKEIAVKWDAARALPAYQEAWNEVFAEKRERAVDKCILTKAQALGVGH
jgi:hypothetical protein